MSPNDENARPGRADTTAGTDEEYFTLLEGRRRALADKRSDKPQGAPGRARSEVPKATPAAQDRRRAAYGGSTRPSPADSAHTGHAAHGAQNGRNVQSRQNGQNGQNGQKTQKIPGRVSSVSSQSTRSNIPRAGYGAPAGRNGGSAPRTGTAGAGARPQLTEDEKRRRAAAAAEAHRRAEARAAAEAAEKAAAAKAEAKRRAEEKKQRREARRLLAQQRRRHFAEGVAPVLDNIRLFLVVLTVISAMLISAFAIRLAMTARKTDTDERGFTYIVEDTKRSLDRDNIVIDDVVYVDFTDIAALCGVGISGTRDELVFEASGGETAVFVPGSDRATVNGTPVALEGKATVKDEHLWLPLSFVKEYFIGVDADLGEVEKRNRKYLVISISRTPDPESTGALGSYIAPAFRLKPGAALSGISPYDTPGIQTPPADPAPTYDFISDLSAYERYMSPDSMTRDLYLLLVNRRERLNYRYTPAGLSEITGSRDEKSKVTLCLNAAKSLEALLTEAAASGYGTVRAATGYVSYDEASALFDSYLSAERNFSRQNYAATGKRFSDRAYAVLGETYLSENYIQKDNYTLSLSDARRVVLSYCDEPGTDEHQSGLAVDLCDTASPGTVSAGGGFYSWLCENAHKFGFIIRYPADKTEATAHPAEPWHLRYVGRYHAAKMFSSGKCLEEYVASIARD